jgi:hypothetical protein
MKKKSILTGALTLLLLMLTPMLAFAQEAGGGFDALVNKIFHTAAGAVCFFDFFLCVDQRRQFPIDCRLVAHRCRCVEHQI